MLTLGGKVSVDLNLSAIMYPVQHGNAEKSLVVLHETVSHDSSGLTDILGPAKYLASKGLGIHGVIDRDGHLGWAMGMRSAIFYHTASNGGNVNTRSVGIELVSLAPAFDSRAKRIAYWKARREQLDKTAQVLAFISKADGIPLRYSKGDTPGITSHWDVSTTYGVAGGHWDCKPIHRGGHFPLLYCIYKARHFYEEWYTSTDI